MPASVANTMADNARSPSPCSSTVLASTRSTSCIVNNQTVYFVVQGRVLAATGACQLPTVLRGAERLQTSGGGSLQTFHTNMDLPHINNHLAWVVDALLLTHQALYQHAKSWRNPVLSIWMHVVAWLMCFLPTAFSLLCIGGALYHAARRADPERGELHGVLAYCATACCVPHMLLSNCTVV